MVCRLNRLVRRSSPQLGIWRGVTDQRGNCDAALSGNCCYVLERRANSELKLINGGLFTLDFLIEGIRDTELWRALTDTRVEEARTQALGLFKRLAMLTARRKRSPKRTSFTRSFPPSAGAISSSSSQTPPPKVGRMCRTRFCSRTKHRSFSPRESARISSAFNTDWLLSKRNAGEGLSIAKTRRARTRPARRHRRCCVIFVGSTT